MEVWWSSIFVLLIVFSVFFLPVLVLFLSRYFYKEFLSKRKIYIDIFCFLLGYLLISLIGIGIYHYFSDFKGAYSTTAIRTDIIYIFTATATLSAPILLLFTVNIWREQAKFNEQLGIIKEIFGYSVELRKHINRLRNNQENGRICVDIFDCIDENNKMSIFGRIEKPDLLVVYELIGKIDCKIKELTLVSSNFGVNDLFDNEKGYLVRQIENFIDELDNNYEHLKNIMSNMDRLHDEKLKVDIVEKLFIVSAIFFKARQEKLMKYVIMHRNDVEIYYLLLELDMSLAKYRMTLEDK